VQLAEAHGLISSRHQVEVPFAEAEALLGMGERARARLERVLEETRAHGTRGLFLGVIHEAGARLALLTRDAERFAHHYAACAQHLKYGKSPALTARLDRLIDQARDAAIAPARDTGTLELSATLVAQQMSSCQGDERGARALKLLMTATGASAGHLFKVGEEGLTKLASFSAVPSPPYLQDFLLRYLQSAEVVNDQTVDVSLYTSIDEANLTLEPVLLSTTRDEERVVAGVAALSFAGGRRWPAPQLLETIAEQLLL
jgi:hypothetical protein